MSRNTMRQKIKGLVLFIWNYDTITLNVFLKGLKYTANSMYVCHINLSKMVNNGFIGEVLAIVN